MTITNIWGKKRSHEVHLPTGKFSFLFLGNNAPVCTGATCLKNAGDLAIGILVWGFGKASNASLIGMLLSFSLITSSRPFPPLILRILGSTIDGVYGGKGGSIINPPADASSNGGDAVGVYGLGQVILTSLNTTVSTLLCFYLFPLLFILYNLVLLFF